MELFALQLTFNIFTAVLMAQRGVTAWAIASVLMSVLMARFTYRGYKIQQLSRQMENATKIKTLKIKHTSQDEMAKDIAKFLEGAGKEAEKEDGERKDD